LAELISGRDDADLLVRLRRRDPESVGLLYDRYGRAAYNLAFLILGRQNAAEGAVAEAVMKCWNRVAAFRETRGSALGVWFLATTYANALEYRGRLAGKALERPAVFQDWSKSLSADRVQETYLAVRKLDAGEKRLLQLTFWEGITPSEVAGRLGHSRTEVESLIESTLAKLTFLDEE
jgi:RNA polymerase sigma-70 factor (ECF subfamily)